MFRGQLNTETKRKLNRLKLLSGTNKLLLLLSLYIAGNAWKRDRKRDLSEMQSGQHCRTFAIKIARQKLDRTTTYQQRSLLCFQTFHLKIILPFVNSFRPMLEKVLHNRPISVKI